MATHERDKSSKVQHKRRVYVRRTGSDMPAAKYGVGWVELSAQAAYNWDASAVYLSFLCCHKNYFMLILVANAYICLMCSIPVYDGK